MTCLDIVCFFEVHQSNMYGKQHRHEFRDWNICCNLKHLQGLTGLRWKCLILPLTVVTNSRFLSRLRWGFWILPQSALSFKLISAFYILASVSDIFKQKPSLRAWGAFCCSRSILWGKKSHTEVTGKETRVEGVLCKLLFALTFITVWCQYFSKLYKALGPK